MEEWKSVFNSKIYEVSNIGNVRNKNTGKYVNVRIQNNYPRISFKGDVNKSYFIYNLIAKIFISNFDESYKVNHKDNNILNNKLENLEIVLKKDSKPKINNLTKQDIEANKKEWFILKECEGYEITKCGLIRNKKNKKLLKLKIDDDGYIQVGLNINKKTKYYRLHRLLSITFIPNPNNFSTVDHINKIRNDNRLENLRWASPEMQSNNQNRQKNINGIKIAKYTENGEKLIEIFNSQQLAANSINLHKNKFNTLIKKTQVFNDYKWVKINEILKINEIFKPVIIDNKYTGY